MPQSDYYSQNSDGLKDKVSNAADAVQQASVDAMNRLETRPKSNRSFPVC
jgi:hypothetical protein